MFKKIFILFAFIISLIAPVYALSDDIEVNHKNGIYVFRVPLKKYKNKIKPYVAPKLTTASDVFHNKDLNFKLVVNGGFFDPKNGAPVSEVTIDKKEVQSLFANEDLVKNLDNQGRVEQVINRSELRILETYNKKPFFDITNHFAIPNVNSSIRHSIQAGPMILPDLRMEEESFIKYDGNKTIDLAADVLKRRERTIIGLKDGFMSNGYMYIIIFTSNHKVSLPEVKEYCKKLHLDKALAMDGGASTSINYKDIEIYSSRDNTRRVKSFLVIEN